MKLLELPDDMLAEICKFLFTDEQYSFACSNTNIRKFAIDRISPRLMKFSTCMETIRKFFSELELARTAAECPACNRENCCSAKCLMYQEEVEYLSTWNFIS